VEIFSNPSEAEIEQLLRRVQTIAVVGLSPKIGRPSYQVAAQMQAFGYHIIPVRPAVASVLGEKAFATLMDVPEKIDLVDVFRAPEHVDVLVEECMALRGRADTPGLAAPPYPWALWLQDGVVNEPAAHRAREAGMTVVMNRCIYRDYLRYFGPSRRP
jgi:predicted CoA-binding protein